jgi:hypothetical protein
MREGHFVKANVAGPGYFRVLATCALLPFALVLACFWLGAHMQAGAAIYISI